MDVLKRMLDHRLAESGLDIGYNSIDVLKGRIEKCLKEMK